MQSSALLTICATQASKSSADAVVRQWLVIFGEIHRCENSPELTEIWCRALADIDPERLDRAFEKAMKTCKFFPTPADICGLIDQAESNARKIEAEAAWNRVFRAASLGGHFDDFDALTRQALGRAGWSYLVNCDSYEGARFAEKQFIAAYICLHETRHAEHLLSDGEAKKIIGQLGTELKRAARRELPPIGAPAAAERLTPKDLNEVRSAFTRLREKDGAAQPKSAMTEADYEARKEVLERQKAQIAGAA